jgi:hypothetical protein
MVNKIPGPHAPRFVLPGSSKSPCVLYPPHVPLTLKKISMLLLQPSLLSAVHSAALYQTVLATGGTSSQTFASVAFFPMRPILCDGQCFQ